MNYDAIIIGTGQAGPPLAAKMASAGYNTAIIEKSHYGGACVNVGCTPTKAYVASARRAFIAKNSMDLGVNVSGGVQVDLCKIKDRKDKLVEHSRAGLKKMLEGTDNLTAYHGRAKLTSPHTVEVNGSELRADKIFINTGARPRIPEGFEHLAYLTNESMLELLEVPGHLIVVGGGYVGLEFAQMFRRFGSEVTIVEMGEKLLSQEDDDVTGAIKDILVNEGIKVRLNAKCIGGEMQGENFVVSLDCKEDANTVTGSHLLLATGRQVNTDNLGLEAAGVEIGDKGFIKVNDRLQTNVPHIWALGDCNGEGAFTHTAYNDYQIVASQLFGDGKRTLSGRFPCYGVFIDPAFARVGMNETEARSSGAGVKMAVKEMNTIARAREMGETQGFLKILVDAETDRILGASFLGAGADEYIHAVIGLMYAKASYTVMRDAVHIHPTISELIPTMLKSLEPLS